MDELGKPPGTKIDNVQLTPMQVRDLKIYSNAKLNQVHQKAFDMYRSLLLPPPPPAEGEIEPRLQVQPPPDQPPPDQPPPDQPPDQAPDQPPDPCLKIKYN